MKSLAATLVVSCAAAASIVNEPHPLLTASEDVEIIRYSEEEGSGFSMRLHPTKTEGTAPQE